MVQQSSSTILNRYVIEQNVYFYYFGSYLFFRIFRPLNPVPLPATAPSLHPLVMVPLGILYGARFENVHLQETFFFQKQFYYVLEHI